MPSALKFPVLESGDHLTRAEFHRRYCERPDIKKAELVEGVVYVASPVRFDLHGEPHGSIVGWLFAYRARHPGVRLGDNATVLLDADNEVQPDAFLFREGVDNARLTGDHYVEGAPPFIVEIAASSASYDLHQKLNAYRRNGVVEYLIWRVLNEAFDWLRLVDGEYVRIEADERGVIESEIFPGLRLNVIKLLAGDLAGVLAELEQGPSRTAGPRGGVCYTRKETSRLPGGYDRRLVRDAGPIAAHPYRDPRADLRRYAAPVRLRLLAAQLLGSRGPAGAGGRHRRRANSDRGAYRDGGPASRAHGRSSVSASAHRGSSSRAASQTG